jgi:GT2 family glycosyltransferase/glycosyltransferase involved in cell wall biosynthesis
VNILFVNYGDEKSNSLNHIHGFASAAQWQGHTCIITLPASSEQTGPADAPQYRKASYKDLLHSVVSFPDRKAADIIHAWTPREPVRQFVETYRQLAPNARLIVHLEDNEEAVLESYSGKTIAELKSLPKKSLRQLIPPALSDLFLYREFLDAASGITFITELLREFCPDTSPTHLLHPGVDLHFFNLTASPMQNSPGHVANRNSNDKLIVYTGGTTFANLKDIQTLLMAVQLLNEHGTPCKLVRTGINPPAFAAELAPLSQDLVIDLGFVEKEEIPSLLAVADALVQPGAPDNFNNYRLPSKVPEFLASGRPTIIPRANIGHHTVDGKHALLLETGSAQEIASQCLRVFRDPELSTRLSVGGREFARKYFDLEKNTLGLLKFYEEVLANTPPRRPRRSIPPVISSWAHSARRFLWPDHTSDQSKQPEPLIEPEYSRWLAKYDCRSSDCNAAMLQRLSTLLPVQQPVLSIVMPVYNAEPRWLALAIDSVRSQLYQNWELCIADDASTSPTIRHLLQKVTASDARIKVIYRERNGHISAASNSALTLVTGAFVILLDHDDELHPQALAEVVLALSKNTDLELIYSDRDKIDQQGKRFAPYFKPDWNPDLLLAQNYLCHLTVFRTDSLRRMGGFRKGYEGSQDWDLVLRYTEKIDPEKIHHIPKILYHWRAVAGSTALHLGEKNSYPQRAAHKALSDHLKRTSATAKLIPVSGQHWRIKYTSPTPKPSVCIIFPVPDTSVDVSVYAEKILAATEYSNSQIVSGTKQNHAPENTERGTANRVLTLFSARITSLTCDGSSDYAHYANQLARSSDSEVLVFLDLDLTPENPSWLDELVSQIARSKVGAVGGHIIGLNKKIRQTGIILEPSVAGDRFSILPAFARSEAGTDGYNNRLRLVQDYSALSADGLAVKRDLFLRLGGFDETFSSHQSAAIDFCLRLRQTGLRVINTPHARLIHANKTCFEIPHADRIALFQRWGNLLSHDPAYNRNLAPYGGGFMLAFPPRLTLV